MRRGVIFDLDGLLFDSETVIYQIFKSTLEKYNHTLTQSDYLSYIGLHRTDMYAQLETSYPELNGKEIIDGIYDAFNKQSIESPPNLKDGALSIIKECAARSLVMAIGTSSPQWIAKLYLHNSKIEDYFTLILGGDQVTHNKPSPEVYTTIAHQLEFSPSDCVVFEDTLRGLQAAANANMRAIHIPDMMPANAQTHKLAYATYQSLEIAKENIDSILS